MKKPMITLDTINRVSEEKSQPLRPESIEKRGDKYFVKKKAIKFLADLQMQVMFREKPTPLAFFKAIKEQNLRLHSEHFDDDLKTDIDEICDQAIKDFGHMKMSDVDKIMNLLKLGSNLFLSNNQHVFSLVKYGKAHLSKDSDRANNRSELNWEEAWGYLKELKEKGVKPHKYNFHLREHFGLSEETFKKIVAKFKKTA